MKKTILNVIFFFFFLFTTIAQVAVNTTGAPANTNAMMDVQSNTKGMLLPRMTTEQRKAIAVTTADAGLLVYDTHRQTIYMYDGNEWLPFAVNVNPLDMLKKKYPATSPQGNFGAACAVSDNYAVVGAPFDTVSNKDHQGSVYTYKRINGVWTLQSRLLAADGSSDDEFGGTITMDGNYLIVGAAKAPNGNGLAAGAAYVFYRSGDSWIQQTKLTAIDGSLDYRFGFSLALEGTNLVVGAPETKVNNNIGQGAVYVFVRNGNSWSQQVKLLAPDGTANSAFGVSVAINNNDIVVGATRAMVGSTKEGAAYLFSKSGNIWPFQKKFVSQDIGKENYYGSSVAVNGNIIAIGALNQVLTSNMTSGVVELYTKTGNVWYYASEKGPINRTAGVRFGHNVVLKNNFLFVSAYGEDIADLPAMGSIYVYKLNPNNYFEFTKRIISPNGMYNDRFGLSMAFDGSSFIGGTPNAIREPGTNGAGMVFFGSVE